MRYATYDEDGLPTGFYAEGIGDIPETAIVITDEDWNEFLDNQGRRKWNGSEVVEYAPPFDPEACTSQIKFLTKQVILNIASIEDQLNLTARAMEILELKTEDTASASDLAELVEIKAMQAKKKAILVKSQELQSQFVEAGEELTPEDIETIREELENA